MIATAIAGKLTMHDLAELDLSYAPPYSSLHDPVNFSGFIGQNAENNLTQNLSLVQLQKFKNTYKILDVRNPGEVAAGALPDSVNIPVNQLRDKIADLDKNLTYMVLCQYSPAQLYCYPYFTAEWF